MKSMLNVYLLRHGETAYNADGNRYCGRTDIPLTQIGIQQALSVYEQLKSISLDAVYSSPLIRAYNTAQIASGREVIKDERLIEADFGEWEGKTKEEFIAEDPSSWKEWMNDPATTRAGRSGETAQQIIDRVGNFFNGLLNIHQSGNILAVGHNGINRFYLAYKLGMPLKHYRRIVQENSSITLFTLDKTGELNLQKLNSRV
jgi:broad specificity phosphatase PhoE